MLLYMCLGCGTEGKGGGRKFVFLSSVPSDRYGMAGLFFVLQVLLANFNGNRWEH